jgi:hypothetical protein
MKRVNWSLLFLYRYMTTSGLKCTNIYYLRSKLVCVKKTVNPSSVMAIMIDGYLYSLIEIIF